MQFIRRFSLGLVFSLVAFLFSSAISLAQTSNSELLVSWQAQTTAPVTYLGKVLPASVGPLTLSVNLLSNNRLVSLVETNVRWFLNNEPHSQGVGLSKITLLSPEARRGKIAVRVEIDFEEGKLIRRLEIPLGEAAIVVETPYPNLIIPASAFSLKATPFFFPGDGKIRYSWFVNGRDLFTETDSITVDFSNAAPGAGIFVLTQAYNPSFFQAQWFQNFRLE